MKFNSGFKGLTLYIAASVV